MFISNFNRHIKNHATATYVVLLIVIIATFVIFVTPGDVFRRGDRRAVSDLGEMYGRKLKVETIRTEMGKTTLGLWLQYPQFFGRELGLTDDVLLQQTLGRMRLLHAGHAMGLDKVTDDEVRKAIAESPVFHENGKFSPEAFKNTLDALKSRMDLLPADFDQTVKDNIVISRVQDKVVESIQVSDDEVNAVLAQYRLKCATIKVDGNSAEPTEEEIQEFFANRKAEIALPETKNALVAFFSVDALRERLKDDAELAKQVTPTQQEIENYFNTNGARLYPGKQLAEVVSEITATLLNEKLGTQVRQRALKLANETSAQVAGESAKEREESFRRASEAAQAKVFTSGPISTDDIVNGVPGAQPMLARAIRGLSEIGQVTGMVPGAGYAAVAYLTDKKATEMPAALPEAGAKANDYLRNSIRRAILREKALAFFQSRIKEPEAAYRAKAEAIMADKSLSNAAREQQMSALEGTLDANLVIKFYVLPTRDFVLASFTPEAYRDQVKEITEEELRKVFDERKDTYQKVKVRLGRIFIATAGLEGDALTAKEAKLAEVQQKLADGADFLAVAKEYSEQSNQEDRALRDLDGLSESLRVAVANLAVDQVSAVVKEQNGSYLVKVLERQDGRAFAEVATELKAELTNAAAKRLADEDAAKFAAELSDKWWNASEKGETLAVAELFDGAMEAYPAAKLDSYTNVSPYAANYPREVLSRVFGASEKLPVTANIVTDSASYVVGLTGETPEHLMDPATDETAYITLLATYRDTVQMENALRAAQAERARIMGALVGDAEFAKVAEPLAFEELPALSQNDITARSQVVTTIENGKLIDIQELAAQLNNAQAGTLLEPLRAERAFSNPRGDANPYQMIVEPVGYQLVYVEGIDQTAAANASEETREGVRERMLATKKSQALNAYMTQLEAESNTQLREF